MNSQINPEYNIKDTSFLQMSCCKLMIYIYLVVVTIQANIIFLITYNIRAFNTRKNKNENDKKKTKK